MATARDGDAGEAAIRTRDGGAKVLRGAGIALTVLLVLLVGAILLLQFDGIATRVVNAAAARFAPWSSVRVAHADLDGLGSLTVADLRIRDAQGDTLIRADSLHVEFRILPLLDRQLVVPDVRIADATIRMEQTADSTWDLLEPFAAPDTAAAPVQSEPWRIRVGEAVITNTQLVVQFAADSVLRVEDVVLRASDIALGDEMRVYLDTLGARIVPPGRPESPAQLAASAQVVDGRLVTRGISLQSDSSHVHAEGELLLPGGASEQLEEIDFTITATPLDFADIGALLPGFDRPGDLTLRGRVTGSATALGIDLRASTSDGAAVDVQGTVTPDTDGPVRYALTGTVSDLDPGLFMDTTFALTGIDAEFDVALAGPRLDAVSGSVRATASARLEQGELRPTTLIADFENGVADVDVEGAVTPWGALDASGTVRPFAEVPTWDLVAEARQLDPITAGASSVRNVTARVRTDGSGISPSVTRGTATVAISGAVGRARIRDGEMQVEWGQGVATVELRLPVEDGRIAGTARIDWSGEATQIEVPSLQTERLRFAALLNDTTRSLISADVSGRFALGRPESLDGRMAAVFEQARWGTLVVDTGRVEAVVDQGVVAVEGRLTSAAGVVQVDARLRPFAEPATWSLRELQVENLDLAAARAGMPVTDIDASLTGELRGSGAQQLSGGASLVIDQATIGGRTVDSARVMLDIASGRMTLDGRAQLFDGTLAFDAALQPFAPTRTLRVEHARFENLRLDSLIGPQVQAALSGTLAATAQLPPDTFPRAQATLTLDGGAFNAGRIEDGRVELALEHGTATLAVTIETEEGEIDIDGRAQLAQDTGGMRLAGGRVEGTLHLPDVARLAGMDTVDAALDAHFAAASTPGDTAAWSLQLAAQGAYDALRIDTLRVVGEWASGILRVDTLRLDSNALHGSGGGVVALGDGARAVGDTLNVILRTDSVDALAPLLGGGPVALRTGTVELRAVGTEQGARINGQLVAGGFILGTTSADTLNVTGSALVADGELRTASAELEAARLAGASVVIDEANATMTWDSAGAAFNVTAIPDETHALRVTGVARPDSQSVLLRQVELDIRDTRWTLEGASRITWGGPITLDSLHLTSGGRSLLVDGRIDRAGTQDLTARLDSVPLGDFAGFLGYDDVTGVTSGTLRMQGGAERVALTGDLRTTIGQATADLMIETDPPGRRLDVNAALADAEGDPLQVTGSIPFDLSLAPREGEAEPVPGEVDMTVSADSFNVAWAEPLVQAFGLDRLRGALNADVHVGGSWEVPRLSGTATLRGGRIRLPQHGVDYRDMSAALTFEGQVIHIDSLRAEADGSAKVAGDITLTSLAEPELALDADLDQFHLITNRWVRLVASGEAHIEGSPLAPQITGDLTLIDTDIYGDAAGAGSAASVELTEEDYEMLESYFGYTPSRAGDAQADRLLPIGMNLDVTLGPDVWLQRDAQPELRVLLSGDLDVRKQPGDSLQLFGSIEAVPERSTFEQFGRQFQVTEGTITFNGPIMSWQANIAALYEVPSFGDPTQSEVDITLAVSGGMENLEITLGSDPAMETGDILSYIATGRPAASAVEFGSGNSGGEGGVLGTGARYALGSATTALENLAEDVVGLSVVEVRQTATGTRLVAGRYVSPRLFVGFQQPLSPDQRQEGLRNQPYGTQLEVEYTAFRWLLVNLQGSASQFRGFFRFKHAF